MEKPAVEAPEIKNEVVEPVQPEVKEPVEPKEPETKKVDSSLKRMVNRYKDTGNGNGKTEDKQEFDYSFLKDIKEEDYAKIDAELEKHGIKGNAELRYKMLSNINEVKKNQRLAQERFNELEKIKKQSPNEKLAKYEEFISDLRKDPFSAFDKYKDDLQLPDSGYISKLATNGGSIEARIAEWQESTLIPQLEKKHKLPDRTFVYDPTEAYKPGTPSYDYRVATEKQQRALETEFETTQKNNQQVLEKMIEERNTGLTKMKNQFFKPASEKEEDVKKADEEFVSFLSRLDGMYAEMNKGDFTAKSNPFHIENIFRGVFFDELLSREKEQLTKSIHAEYAKFGLYLPNRDKPSDVTKMKGSPDIQIETSKAEARKKFSPMYRNLSQYNRR